MALWVLGGGVAIVVAWYALDLVYVSTGNETDHASPADVIIVLGCPSYEGNIVSSTVYGSVPHIKQAWQSPATP